MTSNRASSRVPDDAIVLDGHARQALVTTRMLGRAGLRVGTAESSDLCDSRFGVPTFASRFSLRRDILPSYHTHPAVYGKAVLDLVSAHPTRVLIPSMDGSIAALRCLRSRFEHRNTALALASDQALNAANNKGSTFAAAAELGIPLPRTVAIDSIEDIPTALAEVGLPAVIKPTASWVSKGHLSTRVTSAVVLDESEAVSCVKHLTELGSSALIQQIATGRREAVSVFYARGTVWATFAQAAYRTTPALGGVSVVRQSIPMPPELELAALALVRSLDIEGYCEVEFRRDATGRPLLMEINARLSGSLEVAVRSGVPFPELLWRWAAAEPLELVSGYQTGIKMRYLKGDVKWLWENIGSRRRRPDTLAPRAAVATFARGFFHRQSYDYLDRGDLRPAVAALAGNVNTARRKLSRDSSGRAFRVPAPSRAPRRLAMSSTEVAVIGAGPNGLSVAAHLAAAGVEHRVFGRTMGAWRFNMPAGMLLKSEPYASDLSAPGSGFLARDYCSQANESYHERVTPLTREQFIDYGTWFANQLVPDIDETEIVSLSRTPTGRFLLRTANGGSLRAANVVVATGVIPFAHVPPELAGLPAELVSHSSEYASLEPLRGRDVLVVGGGSSALESSALLLEQGTRVKVIVRGHGVFWPPPNFVNPSRRQQLRKPIARLCEGWHCWAYDRLPDLFRLLPKQMRAERALGFLGPQGAWWLRERVEGRVPMLFDHHVLEAEKVGSRVRLRLQTPEGVVSECADHVIAGTGFRLDLERLDYMAPSLRAEIKTFAGAPILNHSLESNVPGLFFTGALAAPSLGPLTRFVAGVHFAAPRLVHRLRNR